MHKNHLYLIGVVSMMASVFAPLPGVTERAAAQSSSIPGVLSGETSPSGGTYRGFEANDFASPVLNASGQFAFIATLSGVPNSGLFAGSRGSIQTVAVQGATAPDGGTYNNFLSEVINTPGQVAFRAGLTSSEIGIYVGAPGSVQAAALTGTAAPSGGNYSSLIDPVLNDNGQVAFTGQLTGGTSTGGLFAGTPGSMQPIALQGNPAPGGGTFGSIGMPVINRSGLVAFTANLNGAGAVDIGIFDGMIGGAAGAIVHKDDLAPGGGNFGAFDSPVLNAAGQVAFSARLTNTSAPAGIFAGIAGSLADIARQGSAAPRGGNYSGVADPAIDASGAVAFYANLAGGTSSHGIFRGTPGAVKAIALDGDAAPGGGTFSDFVSSVEVNNSGQVAFISNLVRAGSVTFANDLGLYTGTVGNLFKVVRTGDVIDVDPSAGVDNRTVSGIGSINFFGSFNGSGGEDGRSDAFNNAGMLVYRLQFTDGSSGVFTLPVPEPTGLALLSLAGLVMLRHRCRRGCSESGAPTS